METALKITRSIVVAAGRERIWKALTVPEEIGLWFEQLEFERLAVGEKIRFSWGEKGEIAIVEPMDRFGYRWLIEPQSPRGTLVVFTLETIPNGTRVTVSETGFEALPDSQKNFSQNTEGWEEEMGALEVYLEARET